MKMYSRKLISVILIFTLLMNTVSTGFADVLPGKVDIKEMQDEILEGVTGAIEPTSKKAELEKEVEDQISKRYGELKLELDKRIKTNGLAENIMLSKLLDNKSGYGRVYTILDILGGGEGKRQEGGLSEEEAEAFYATYSKEINEIYGIWLEKYKGAANELADKVINDSDYNSINEDIEHFSSRMMKWEEGSDLLIEILPFIRGEIGEDRYKKLLGLSRKNLEIAMDVCIKKDACGSAEHLIVNQRYMYLEGEEGKYLLNEIFEDGEVILNGLRHYGNKTEGYSNYVGLIGIAASYFLALKYYNGIRRIISDAKIAERKLSRDEEPMTKVFGGLSALLMPGTVIYTIAEELDTELGTYPLYDNRIGSLPSNKGRYMLEEGGKEGNIWWDLADMLSEEGSAEAQKILDEEISEIKREGKNFTLGNLGILKISALVHRKASSKDKVYSVLAQEIANIRFGDLSVIAEEEIDKGLLERYPVIKEGLKAGAVVDSQGKAAKEKATKNMTDLRSLCLVIDISAMVVGGWKILKLGYNLIKNARNIGVGLYKTMKAGRIGKSSGKAAQIKYIRNNIQDIRFYKEWKGGIREYEAGLLGGNKRIAPKPTVKEIAVKESPAVKETPSEAQQYYMYVEENGHTYKLSIDGKGKIKKTLDKQESVALNKIRKNNLSARQKRKIRTAYQAESEAQSQAKIENIFNEIIQEGLTPKDSKGVRYGELNWLQKKGFDLKINADIASDLAADFTNALVGNPKRLALTTVMFGTGEAPAANAFMYENPVQVVQAVKGTKAIKITQPMNLYDPNSYFGGASVHAGSGMGNMPKAGRTLSLPKLTLAPSQIIRNGTGKKLLRTAAGLTAIGLIANELFNPTGNILDVSQSMLAISPALFRAEIDLSVDNFFDNLKEKVNKLPAEKQHFLNFRKQFDSTIFRGQELNNTEKTIMRKIIGENFADMWFTYYNKGLISFVLNDKNATKLIKYSNRYENTLLSQIRNRFNGTNPLYIFTMRKITNQFVKDLTDGKTLEYAIKQMGEKLFQYHKKIAQIKEFLEQKELLGEQIYWNSVIYPLTFPYDIDFNNPKNAKTAELIGFGKLNTMASGYGFLIHSKNYSEYLNEALHKYKHPTKYKGINMSLRGGFDAQDVAIWYPNGIYDGVSNNDLAFKAMEEDYNTIKPLINKYQNGQQLTESELNIIHNTIADLSYILTNAIPFYRGTSALNLNMVYGLYEMLGIDAPQVKEGRALDLSAFITTPEDYQANWKNLFAADFPKQTPAPKKKTAIFRNTIKKILPVLIPASAFGLTYLLGGDIATGLTFAAIPFIGTIAANKNKETPYKATLTFSDQIPNWKEKLFGFTPAELNIIEQAFKKTDAQFDDVNSNKWQYKDVLIENLNKSYIKKKILWKGSRWFQLLDDKNKLGFQVYYHYRSYVKFLQLYKQNPSDVAKNASPEEKNLAYIIKKLKGDPKIGYPLIEELNYLWANNSNIKKNQAAEDLLNNKKEYEQFLEENGRNPKIKSTNEYERLLASVIRHTMYYSKNADNPIVNEIKELWAKYTNQRTSKECLEDLIKFHAEHNGVNPKLRGETEEESRLASSVDYYMKRQKKTDPIADEIRKLYQEHIALTPVNEKKQTTKSVTKEEKIAAINANWIEKYKIFLNTYDRNPSRTNPQDSDELKLARAINRIKYQKLPFSGQVKELWDKYFNLRIVEEPHTKWINAYTAFVKEKGRNPKFDEKNREEYNLANNIKHLRKNYIDSPSVQQIDKLWTDTELKLKIDGYKNLYAQLQSFIAENNRLPISNHDDEHAFYYACRRAMISDIKDPVIDDIISLWKDTSAKQQDILSQARAEKNAKKQIAQERINKARTERESKRLEKQEQINKTREEREAKLLEKQYLAEQARIERELKKLEKIQNKKAKKTSPFDLVIQRYLETEQWLKLYKEFLQENGRNPSKDIESEKELAQNIKRIRLSNGNSKYKNLALELWNKYPTKEQLDNTENVYKDFRAFVEANGRNPKNNATDKAEKTLAIRISATKNIRDIVKSDYMQKIIDLWNQNELNVKISAWTVLYADLQKFIAENGHVPNSVSTNYEETRLRHGYHNAVKSGIEHPIIEQLKTLWQNTRKETISAANINKDLLKYQQYLDEYREFLKTNNRNPSVKAVDQQEAALAKAISNIMRNSRNRNPIAHDFRALWNMYYISKVKIVKPDADYVQEYKEFVKTNERNPNQENSKEERILFTKINAMVKDDGNPYSHELRGLWGFYSKGKQKNYIVTPDQWLTLYNNFIIQNGNKPSEAGKRSERHLAWAATYIFENTLADDPLRNKFQELFEDFETNREDYSEAADNEDFEDDIIIKTKKRNTGKEEDLATMYIDYLIKNNLGIAESTVLPKTKEEKDTFYNKYITFVNENKVIPSAFSGDKEERLLALTLKELASDVYSVEAYVGTLLGLERRFTAPATTEKLYEEFERYLEQLKLMPNRNSKFYKEIYFRLRYGTKDAKDINDFGKLYALYQVAKAVGEGEISWDDDLQMTINSNIENELAIPVEGLQQLYDGLPLNSKRIVRAMEENYQELKNHFPAWLEQNKDNIVWNDATAQALKQVEKGIKNNSSSATAALVAISQMDLGKKYDGRNNSLIYRGTDLNNLEETDFHILSERIGMYYFEEPSVPAITFKTEITKLTGLILHEGVTAKDLQETLEQIAKDGSYLIRVEKQDLGLINNTLNNDGINGKLYVHLEKTLPIANDEGISVDAAVLLEIDASALTKGKTETEIVELYKQLFRGF